MKISEIFYSVQGEGSTLGLPTIFIRLSGCNLQCSWCDSKYALTESKEMSVEEIYNEIQQYPCYRVVITGGEPLLQKEALTNLVLSLNDEDYIVEIETNGTISPGKTLLNLVDQWNISPKSLETLLSISQTERSFPIHTNHLFIKIVVEKDLHQISWAHTFARTGFPREHIILMPCAINIEDQQTILPMLVEAAKKYGFRVSPRLQILTYGNKRGV